jgi:hypothetical protein
MLVKEKDTRKNFLYMRTSMEVNVALKKPTVTTIRLFLSYSYSFYCTNYSALENAYAL